MRVTLPAEAWKQLRRAYFTSGDRNTRLFRELRTVLERLRSAGIPVIVLKGASLAEAVYGDVALRPMCDSDLLVPQTDLARAEAVLFDLGGVHKQFQEKESRRRPKHHAPPILICDLAIELHRTIVTPAAPVRVDVAGLWDRACPATVAGIEVLSLSPEDLLLHLCLHFCYDNGCVGLRYLCDIAETIRHFGSGLDWPRIADRARKWDATKFAGLSLHLARAMLGAAVPDDVLERLVPEGIDQRVLAAAQETVLSQTSPHQWGSLFDAQGARSPEEKAEFFKERVFLSRDEMAAKYPASRGSSLFPLYYALRLRDGVRAYTFHALRRARLLLQRRRRERHNALHNWLTRP